jgi:hypothetical protein
MNPNSSAAILPMFPIDVDFDDDVDTQLDMQPFSLLEEESYVGVRPREDDASIEEAVRSRHEELALGIEGLEQVCASFDIVDVSAQAAQVSLRRRVGSLSMLRLALGNVTTYAQSADHTALFGGEGPLAPYLAGVYLWANDVTETLAELAHGLNALTPDWSAFRERLADVAWIYEMALAEQRKLDGKIADEELMTLLDDVAIAFVGLKHKLDEPFG